MKNSTKLTSIIGIALCSLIMTAPANAGKTDKEAKAAREAKAAKEKASHSLKNPERLEQKNKLKAIEKIEAAQRSAIVIKPYKRKNLELVNPEQAEQDARKAKEREKAKEKEKNKKIQP